MKKEYRTIKPEEFDIFKRIKGNRKVLISLNKNNFVTKRLELFESLKTFEQISDVLCCWHIYDSGEKVLTILDGQHRLAACQILKIPLDVKIFSQEDDSILTNEQVNEIVKTANNTSKPWTNLQHLEWDSIFNGNLYAEQYLSYRETYKALDDGALYSIVTGGNYFGAKRAIQSSTLDFDLSEDNLKKLGEKLIFINNCSTAFIKQRRKLQLKGLRKVTINIALEALYVTGYKDETQINNIFLDWDKLESIDVSCYQNCFESILDLLEENI